jgi:hypothetical protein
MSYNGMLLNQAYSMPEDGNGLSSSWGNMYRDMDLEVGAVSKLRL